MCDVLWPCDNSAQASTSFTSTFNQLTSSTSNYITTNSSSASSSISAYQTATIEIDGDVYPGCTIDQSQTINLTSQTGVNLSKTSTQDLRNFITANLQNAANQQAQATSSTMGGGASTATNTTINQTIQNVVNTTVSDSNYASMSAEALGQQDGVIKIHGNCHAPINQDQYFCANVLATNIMTQIATQLGGLQSDTTSTNTVTQTGTSYTKGPIESITSMFSGQGIAGIIGAICCLLICLMSCGLAAFVALKLFKP